jgi:hypothetical protein
VVNLSSSRVCSVGEAQDRFNALIADAADGLMTHVAKGSTVVAHIVPPHALLLDDPHLRVAMISALAEQEAQGVAETEWRAGRLAHAGDTMGRLLAWGWRTDPKLCMRALAHFHKVLQSAVGEPVDLAALWGGVRTALRVRLNDGEIAAVFRHVTLHYENHYLFPLGDL